MTTFYYKSTCSTCRKAKALLESLGVDFAERNMAKEPLTEPELRELIGDRELKPFVNTHTDMYRERNMKAGLPGKDELISLMAGNPNLIRRPLLVHTDGIIYGLDEGAYWTLAE